jgi:tripartite-type tricarboxylate transporter receptor subunit TctC
MRAAYATFAGALAASISISVAQEAKPSYLGKQVRMVIANSPGGSYDVYARVLGQHLSRHIPGSPTIINQNMPTASGMQATNWAYSSAPKDGSVMLATYNSLLAEPLYGNSAVRYDILKFKFVGSISKQQNLCATWHTNPVKTIAQARQREVIVTANGTASDSYTLPKILNALLGTKFKTITGYATAEARLAVEHGEADGVCGLSWSTLKTSNTEWVQKRLPTPCRKPRSKGPLNCTADRQSGMTAAPARIVRQPRPRICPHAVQRRRRTEDLL